MAVSAVKVLVIEDEPDLTFYLSNLLRRDGFDPVVVPRWQEAMSTAQAVNPALIILDAMLPDDASQKIYGALKTNALLKQIPVAMLSSLTGRAFTRYHLAAAGMMHGRLPGPEAVLAKPPEADEFITTVRQLCATCVNPQEA